MVSVRQILSDGNVPVSEFRELVALFEDYRFGFGQARDPERSARFLEQCLANRTLEFFGAGEPGVPLCGFASIQQGVSTVARESLVMLKDLYVAPPHRRRGVARGLLDRVVEQARKQKQKGVVLDVFEGNDGARALYESCGFQVNHYFRSYRYLFADEIAFDSSNQ